MNEEVIECPCRQICTSLGIETGRWCRYRKSDLPPPGMHSFDPKEKWCQPGVQANVMLLAHLVRRNGSKPATLDSLVEQVRRWAKDSRSEEHPSHLAPHDGRCDESR